MRIRKRLLRARVNPGLPITFSNEQISAHGGLELFGRFLAAIDLRGRIRQALRGLDCQGDYGAWGFLRCLMGLLLVGGHRITHPGGCWSATRSCSVSRGSAACLSIGRWCDG